MDEVWDTSSLEQAQTEMGRKLDATRTPSGDLFGDVPVGMPWQFWTPDTKPCTIGRWAEMVEQKRESFDPETGEVVIDDWTRVGDDRVGNIRISTVWLGMNHAFFAGPPLIFETMVFGGKLDQEQWRYSTLEQARDGHAAAVSLVRAAERKAVLIRGLLFLGAIVAVLIVVLLLSR